MIELSNKTKDKLPFLIMFPPSKASLHIPDVIPGVNIIK
jgi:hypothetical protein